MGDIELTGKQIRRLMGLSVAQLRFWGDGTLMNIGPSVASGRQGATSLYSIGDFYLLSLAQSAAIEKQSTFKTIGAAIDAIAADSRWPMWAENRGLISVTFESGELKRLTYAARVVDPDGYGRTLSRGGEGGLVTWPLERAMEKASRQRDAREVAAEFLNQTPDFTNQANEIEMITARVEKVNRERTQQEKENALREMSAFRITTVLTFDLKVILGEADQRLEKVLNHGKA